jgi:hypothetical protein
MRHTNNDVFPVLAIAASASPDFSDSLEKNLLDGNRRHGLVAGFVSLRVPELGPLLTR